MSTEPNGSETEKLLNYGSLKIRDHFTLRSRSSRIHFTDTNTVDIVWTDGNQQYVIEDDYDDDGKDEVEQMKLIDVSTTGQTLLRAACSLVAVFFSGFLLVGSFQLLLYLILDVLVQSGRTSDSIGGGTSLLIGTILAFPMYISGLSLVMVVASSYVVDTWNGNALLKRFAFGAGTSGVIIDWATFLAFLGLPIMVMCGSIFAGKENWWEITVLFWFYSIAFSFVIYFFALVTISVLGTFNITKNWRDLLDDGVANDSADFFETLSQAIQTRCHHYYSGLLSFQYITKGSIDRSGVNKSSKDLNTSDRKPTRSFWLEFLSSKFMDNFFEDVDDEQKSQGYNVVNIGEDVGHAPLLDKKGIELFDMNDVQGFRPFITRKSWSLERIYCSKLNSRQVLVFSGPEAITRPQMISSIVCFFLGTLIKFAVFGAVLFWLKIPIVGIIGILAFMLLVMYPRLLSRLGMVNAVKDIKWNRGDEVHSDTKSLGMFQVYRQYRVRQPKRITCFLIFAVQVVLFLLWPTVTLYTIGNYKTATVFLILGLIVLITDYFDPAIVLEATNEMNFVTFPDQPQHETNPWSDDLQCSEEHWTKQSRLTSIVKNVNRSRYKSIWTGVFVFFLAALGFLFTNAILTKGQENTNDHVFNFLPDFEYKQQKDLPYPTCNIGKGTVLGINGHGSLHLSDYVFVAGLAYSDDQVTQPQLDKWFGNGIASNNDQYVKNYRDTFGDHNAVSYKFITFNRSENELNPMGLISIRGTVTAWDTLTDLQLWSAASIFQVLRQILPGGQIWTPILNHLVKYISWLASESINRVAFYKETTAFAEYLLKDNNYDDIQVTGHSLGGGLAIITAAQTNIPGIALSGPNAMIGRTTFDPPVTEEALNTMTFNIIPDRDVVPRLDDRAKLFQEINCLADSSDVIGCHNSYRSLCEIIYTCGTMGRPALCECQKYGYPAPTPKPGTNITFEEACAAAGTVLEG